MADDSSITIRKCPLCSLEHSYRLAVERSITHTFVNPFGSGASVLNPSSAVVRTRRFIQLFRCPNTHENFQASIVLRELESMPISSVDVVGLQEEQ